MPPPRLLQYVDLIDFVVYLPWNIKESEQRHKKLLCIIFKIDRTYLYRRCPPVSNVDEKCLRFERIIRHELNLKQKHLIVTA